MSRADDPVADELAIRDLVHRYADAASRRDAGGVARTFSAEGEWQAVRFGRHRGDALEPFFTRMLDGWNGFVQALLSGRVVLDGRDPDRAQGRWYVQEIGQRSEGTWFDVAGVYHDEYVRGADGWRIAWRRYDPLLSRTDGVVTATPFPTDVPEI